MIQVIFLKLQVAVTEVIIRSVITIVAIKTLTLSGTRTRQDLYVVRPPAQVDVGQHPHLITPIRHEV